MAPLRPFEEEVIDIAERQPDGSTRIAASYSVDFSGALTWLTPDSLPPKDFLS